MGATRISVLAAAMAALAWAASAQENVTVSHARSLTGEPKYGPDFAHLDYVNPEAPKGGDVRLFAVGSYDSLNPFIVKGVAAAGVGLIYDGLTTQSLDDATADYGLIAESIEVPDDLSWVAFTLRDEARWHDGSPITVEDVVFSLNTMKDQGHPFYRYYYGNVTHAEEIGPRKVRFTFSESGNCELPQIVGQLQVIPKAYFTANAFDETSLEAPLGSGPYRIRSIDPGRSIAYERVEDYWAADLPINRGRYNFDTVRYDYYRDQTVALEAFKAQEYDYRFENNSKLWATSYDFPAIESGRAITRLVPDGSPTGMQSFAFNLRKPKFQDRALRRALAYAFDFEWSNKNLFYGQYDRTTSYFSNSALASSGLPTGDELSLLEPYRDQLPAEVFTQEYQPPTTDGTGNIRANLREALKILREAGWELRDQELIDPGTDEQLEIEFLLVSPAFERIVAPFIENLKRLGVSGRIRTVDTAQYSNRVEGFDFDMVVASFGQSESPGNEQRDYWGSEAAGRQGSRNVIGINNPVVDELVEKIIFTPCGAGGPEREGLVAATRALDRVLLWQHYLIPNWHIRYERIAYWNKFGRTDITPTYGTDLFAWWVDPAKEAALASGKSAMGGE